MFPKTGNMLPGAAGPVGTDSSYAHAISAALRHELGNSRQAVKTVVRWTNASERSVKNWFAATKGPRGGHLVLLVRNSDEVLHALLMLAGRDATQAPLDLLEIRNRLVSALRSVDAALGR